MVWLIAFIYIFFIYGASVIITQGIGPKNILVNIRTWAENVGPNFGLLFRCMLCMPTNLGILFSLLFWFLIPNYPLTPGAIFLCGTSHAWWFGILAAIIDGCVCAGISHFIWNLDDFIDKSTPGAYEYVDQEDTKQLLND